MKGIVVLATFAPPASDVAAGVAAPVRLIRNGRDTSPTRCPATVTTARATYSPAGNSAIGTTPSAARRAGRVRPSRRGHLGERVHQAVDLVAVAAFRHRDQQRRAPVALDYGADQIPLLQQVALHRWHTEADRAAFDALRGPLGAPLRDWGVQIERFRGCVRAETEGLLLRDGRAPPYASEAL